MSKKTRTTFLLNAVDSEDATNLYNKLKNNIEWDICQDLTMCVNWNNMASFSEFIQCVSMALLKIFS